MTKQSSLKWITLLVAGLAGGLVNATTLNHSTARPSKQAPRESTKSAEQVYKNIQALTGLPASELDGVMYFMSAALGVGCTHCHTNPWDSDLKSAKLAARRMILMTRAINKDNFSSNPAVTCFTCHRGKPGTVPNPPPDLTAVLPDVAANSAKPSTLPPSDEIIDRYTRAIGGAAAIDKLKTRVSRGTETTTNRMTPPVTFPIELYQTAENKLAIIRRTPQGSVTQGFNGSAGWIKDDQGQRSMSEKLLDGFKRDADFYRFLKLRDSYPQMRTLDSEQVEGRQAYVVGATSREGTREKLYFDARTGLLIRKYIAFNTAFGSIPELTDFDDYRDVGGIKLPFTVIWSRPPFTSTRKFEEVKINVELKDGMFEMAK